MADDQTKTAADEVLYYQDGHIATITLNAPERMNTISPAMTNRIAELLISADADADIRAIILTGAGQRAFCAISAVVAPRV